MKKVFGVLIALMAQGFWTTPLFAEDSETQNNDVPVSLENLPEPATGYGGYGMGKVGSGTQASSPSEQKVNDTSMMKSLLLEVGSEAQTSSLSKEEIQTVVRKHRDELRACYEQEVAKVKGLRGKIDVNWVIAADGSVFSAGINESTIKNENVENCVLNAIKDWRFPAPKRGMVRVSTYPFVFELPE